MAFFAIFLIITAQALYAQKPLKVGEVTAQPGEKKQGFIVVPAGSDGPEQRLPVTIVNGTKTGAVLALTAGTHGYEYPPILALQRLAKQLDPAQISGAVILVHVVNMPSFLKRTIYYNPYDWQNQNRVFPGKINGTMTERIAYQITKEVIDKCDYLIDMHCGDGNEDLVPYLYCTETGDPALDKKTHDLAVAFGFKIIILETNRPKDKEASMYLENTALLRGKSGITIEAGKLGMTDEEDITMILNGAYNTLKHLKIMPGTPERRSEPVWVKEYTIIRSENDGIFYPLVHRGYHVQKDELVGYLTDFFGNTIQEVKSPYDGIVLYIISTPPMSKGEPMISIGKY
jgi:hypothetical protein